MKLVLEETIVRANENKKLRQISGRGFCQKAGCFFLEELYQPHFDQYTVSQFHDETGFEAFVNSVHLRDYCNGEFLGMGLGFIEQTFQDFEAGVFNRRLKASFSLLNDDAVAKLYVAREGQEYLSDDLEGYDTAVLEMDRNGLVELSLNQA
jgi:hypothetical protein